MVNVSENSGNDLCNVGNIALTSYSSFVILSTSVNVFKGLFKNWLFVGILVTTSILQVIIVEIGGKAMHVADGGLDWKYWGLSMGIGVLSLPIQQIINFIFKCSFEKAQ